MIESGTESGAGVRLRGVLTAMVTPFGAEGAGLDESALEGFIAWQLDAGVHGLVPCGTTGEAPTLTPEEHDRVIARTVELAAGRVPVVAGTGSNATSEAVARTRHAERAGADAAMLVTPYYNKPDQAGMVRHFEAVLEATDAIPIVVYNIPGRSVVDLELGSIRRLLRHRRFIGIKDATRDLVRPGLLRRVLAEEGRSDDFFQLSGEDPTALGFLAQGGHGCISVSSNVAPAQAAALQDLWASGDLRGAQAIDAALQPLHAAMFCAPSPGPAKYALSLSGRVRNSLRLPILPVDESAAAQIRAALARVEARSARAS